MYIELMPFPRLPSALFSLFLFCSCGTELDFRGAERLQFFRTTPPNIKTEYELILGNLESQKYKDIHGPVKSIQQKNYLLTHDETGKLSPPHFSGSVEIHYHENGSIADFVSFDSTGSLHLWALNIHKANRRELYVHRFDSNIDFVFFLSNDNRIIEESLNPFYRQSPLDSSWNSTDGHFSWEENASRKITAATGNLPSASYRHLYTYNQKDSLIRVDAFDLDGKKRGSLEREFKDDKLQSVKFRFDERIFYPNLLNFTESYQYDSLGRLSKIITKRSKASSPQNDTVSYAYSQAGASTVSEIYRNHLLESKTIYDSIGNATFVETHGTFIYEGSSGTAESYDTERLVRQIEYYGHTSDSNHQKTAGTKSTPTSLSANAFFRTNSDSSAFYCTPSSKQILCRQLRKVPGTLFLNYVESVSYQNASEVFLEKNAAPKNSPLLRFNGKCALVIQKNPEFNAILFENSLVKFKRNPYEQFFGDTLIFSKKEFPCELNFPEPVKDLPLQ